MEYNIVDGKGTLRLQHGDEFALDFVSVEDLPDGRRKMEYDVYSKLVLLGPFQGKISRIFDDGRFPRVYIPKRNSVENPEVFVQNDNMLKSIVESGDYHFWWESF